MSFVCEYCNRILSTRSGLKAHQKNALVCLETRNIIKTQINKESSLILQKSIEQYKEENQRLHKEIEILTLKLEIKEKELKEISDRILKDKEKEIHELKHIKNEDDKFVKTLASRPVTTINNTKIQQINCPLDLSTEIVTKTFESFDEKHFNNGETGLAIFTFHNFLYNKEKNQIKYICNDLSRGIFSYKDLFHQIIRDYNAVNLLKHIKDPLLPIITKIRDKLMNGTENIEDLNQKDLICIKAVKNFKECNNPNKKFIKSLSKEINKLNS